MWLMSFFQENDGKPSMTRLMSFICVMSILVVFVSKNMANLSKTGEMTDFSTNSIAVVFLALGAKVAHSALKDKLAKDVAGALPDESASTEDKPVETK